eukprot:2397305-Rhodomonas_salina.2
MCPFLACGALEASSLTNLTSMESMINKLHVQCRYASVVDGSSPGPKNLRHRSRANEATSSSEAGCGWIGAVGDLAKHLRDSCTHAEVECTFRGCNAKVQRFQLAEHEGSCEQREISCEKCEERVKASELSEHLLGCKLVFIDCPQECGARVLRVNLDEHEKECPNVVVCCLFADYGCKVREKRRKLGEHEEQAVVAHSRLAARCVGRVLELNAALEQEVSELKQALAGKTLQYNRTFELSGMTNQFNHSLMANSNQLKESLVEKTSQVRRLEARLEKCKRTLAAAAAPPYGEVSVTWKIENFSENAKGKEEIDSNVFHVQTKAGAYHMYLSLGFSRKGYAGLFVCSTSEEGGCTNFPVDLEGTSLTVEKGVLNLSYRFQEGQLVETVDDSLGWDDMMSADEIQYSVSRKRKERAFESNPVAGEAKPEFDVADFLEDDTLTIQGCIRLTPAEKISI